MLFSVNIALFRACVCFCCVVFVLMVLSCFWLLIYICYFVLSVLVV